MANFVQTIEKYITKNIDAVFATASCTNDLEGNQKWVDLNFKEAGVVKIYSILTDGLSDYHRANSDSANIGANSGPGGVNYTHWNGGSDANRDGFRIGSVSGKWEYFKLRYYRAKQFPIDDMDNEETAGLIIGNTLTEFLRTKVVPEVDAVRFSTIAGAASAALGNRVSEDLSSTVGIIDKWNEAIAQLVDLDVPEEDLLIYVNPKLYAQLLADPALTKYITQSDYKAGDIVVKVASYNGHKIVRVPSSRFFTDVVVGDNGFYAGATSNAINYIICSNKAVTPVVKLEHTKIWTPDQVQDFIGYKVNFAIYHDCFVPSNKVPGVYVSVSQTAATSNALYLDVENGVLTRYFTKPAGILGALYAFTAKQTVGATVDVSSLTEVSIGDTLTSGNFYALVRDGSVIAATLTAVTF